MEIEIREQQAGDIAALEEMFGKLLLYYRAADPSSGNGEQIDPNSARMAQIYLTACEKASHYARTERSYQRKFVAVSNGRVVGFMGYHDIYGPNAELSWDVTMVTPELDVDAQRELSQRLTSVYYENVGRDSGPGY